MRSDTPLVPAVDWLRGYPRQWLLADVGAGLIAAAVVIPKAMAFATPEDRLRHAGVTLWLVALNPDVLTVVKRSKIGQALGRERMFFNLQAAIETYTTGKVVPRG